MLDPVAHYLFDKYLAIGTISVDETETYFYSVDEMATDNFGFVRIPDAFAELIGTPDKGTRIFRAEGTHAQMRRWFDALCQHIGPCVSPGGAAVYSGTSRAGVYKRMKAGGLTAFCFHITGKKKTWLGRDKKLKEWALVYIPVSECKSWRADLERRLERLEQRAASEEDHQALEEADPDENETNPDFVHYDPKDKGRRDVKYSTWEPIPESEEREDGK